MDERLKSTGVLVLPVCVTYLWKDSCSVNCAQRCFPTTPVSYNNNFEFLQQAWTVCSWSFLGHGICPETDEDEMLPEAARSLQRAQISAEMRTR